MHREIWRVEPVNFELGWTRHHFHVSIRLDLLGLNIIEQQKRIWDSEETLVLITTHMG